ncbi:SRPBCC domain-containing protein [Echinicola sp. CAU 1574]|uniref:SRPBCC domain-containing protein n=1 Tax=Echinicola arenosa TaxID=2774144 RepID=A0ABR9AQH8_9BACT|nr:SRPBCC domain-containing protein [Echinicola arenosa]MBD8490622.1 SRPBCC domain-containing protein [Echinicola arenosa]
MELKTKVNTEEGKQEIFITREFDLPVDLLFKAYIEPQIVEQWMGTKVLKLESKKHGSFQFETTDPKGNKHCFNGVIHEFTPNEKIIRTFEMEGASFGVQLEVLEFLKLTSNQSKLQKQVIYQSVAYRDENLKLPFRQGINWAHNRLEEIVKSLK